MRRSALWFWTWTIVIAIAAVVGFEIVLKITNQGSYLEADIIAGVIGVAAGILAILFQRRSEFVATLRNEWNACLEAMAAVRTLYMRVDPKEDDYLEAYAKLSEAIDGMRAVYRNNGEAPWRVGLYPFSTLHDVRLMLEKDFRNGACPSATFRQQRLEQITECWRLFRRRFLNELETPEADRPILKRLDTDKRKHGVSWFGRYIRFLPRGEKLTDADLELPPPASAASQQTNEGEAP